MPTSRPNSRAKRQADPAARQRILRQARQQFFAHGYSTFTMAELAADLGISKKTLYVHFTSKEHILRAVIDELGAEIRHEADELLANRYLNFAEKLRGFAIGMFDRLSRVNPRAMRDLQRFAPDLHQRLVEMREKNIPYIFGRFIEEGQLAGMVRPELDTAFAVQFFLHAMQGLMQAASIDKLNLAPREIPPRAIELFFAGLLTPTGRKDHEKLFPR